MATAATKTRSCAAAEPAMAVRASPDSLISSATAPPVSGDGAMTGRALIAQPERALDAEHPDRTAYRCSCGHVLRVFGGGRHRVYFELGSARLDDPVLNRLCPVCGRALPGKSGR
jgi:hypothetical protein